MAVAVLVWAGVAAGAPTLDQLRREVSELKYPDATKTIAALEATEGLPRADVVSFFLHAGLVRAALKDEAGAREAFSRALVVEPTLELPGKPSPRVTTPFAAAKSWAQAHGPLTLSVSLSRVQDSLAWTGELRGGSDEKRLVGEVVVVIEEDGQTRQVRGTLAALPRLEGKGLQVRLTWWLLSAKRWVLAEGTRELAAAVPVVGPPARVSKAAPRVNSFPRVAGWILAIASAPLVTLGALNLSAAQSRANDARAATVWDELQDELRRGRNAQTEGIVFLSVAGAALLGGSALLVLGYLPEPESAKVGFAPIAGGAVFTLGGAW